MSLASLRGVRALVRTEVTVLVTSLLRMSLHSTLGEGSRSEGSPGVASDSLRALRSEIMRILGETACPPPSAPSVPERTSVLSSFVALLEAPKAPAKSLPEDSGIATTLQHVH